ncbi:MAG: hypothetical protein POELPBGB_01951 [Bacteroidia bacterium]|nr:hypothetical protein [Bacteroidia bacterium]
MEFLRKLAVGSWQLAVCHLERSREALIILFSVLLVSSCQNETDKPKPVDVPVPPAKVVPTPDFNQDSAFQFVKKQVDFGPRVPNSAAHAKCADYLTAKFKEYKAEVIVQQAEAKAFDGKVLKMKNIIAQWQPEKQNRIMLCAHWDTRPFADQDTKDLNKPIDGANDGGSGVGVLLEIGRQLAASQPNIGVDIILFDAEDYGQPDGGMQQQQSNSYCLGSQYWATNKHKQDYAPRYAILLDMVGAKNATFTMEGVSMQFASHVVKKVWDTALRLGYSSYFVYDQTNPITDDHYYINTLADIPAIDIIHYDPATKYHFAPVWHTHNDNIQNIDPKTLKAVGQTLLEVVYSSN